MERYTDLALLDTAGAVERLPVPGGAGRARKGGAAALRTWDRRGEEQDAAQG